MMTKYVRTKEDWVEIGEATKKMSHELNHLFMILQHHFGKSDKNTQRVYRAHALVEQVRCKLEDQMFYENPDLSNHWLELFYGPDNFEPEDDDHDETGSHSANV